MKNNYFMSEVAILKQVIQEASRIKDYTSQEIEELIGQKIKERILWAKEKDSQLYQYYLNMSFKEKNTLKFTVIESVEGLGILGKIITDPDITEVMINGYDTIFVEKAGKLMRLQEHFQDNEDLVRMETKKANSKEATEITIRDLIKASLRMRPDRIIVGEVRGEEALDMLQAMNTGHVERMYTKRMIGGNSRLP